MPQPTIWPLSSWSETIIGDNGEDWFMKVELLIPSRNPFAWNKRTFQIVIKKCVPYFRSGFGNYTHRIRSGQHHYLDGEYRHTTFKLWCGQLGFMCKDRPQSKLLQEPNAGDMVCATCEGRAIGSGQSGTHEICGHFVKFSPRI